MSKALRLRFLVCNLHKYIEAMPVSLTPVKTFCNWLIANSQSTKNMAYHGRKWSLIPNKKQFIIYISYLLVNSFVNRCVPCVLVMMATCIFATRWNPKQNQLATLPQSVECHLSLLLVLHSLPHGLRGSNQENSITLQSNDVKWKSSWCNWFYCVIQFGEAPSTSTLHSKVWLTQPSTK